MSLRRLLPRLILLTCVLALMGGLYGWRFHHYRSHLRSYATANSNGFATQQFPGLSAAQVVQIGSAHTAEEHPHSSYIAFPEKKKPGIFRIGVFGCSFVRGSEAADRLDPVSQAAQLLHAMNPAGRVELLNFGVGGFGLQQMVLLWEALARVYELDLVVFHLFGFHPPRDTGFILLEDTYAPVHARYVLRDRELQLVKVVGDDRREAAREFFSLLPHWRYLRYDSKAPPQLRALVPHGRSLGSNPLYYRADPAQEIAELYPRLLGTVAEGSPRLLVVAHTPDPLSFLFRNPTTKGSAHRGHSYRLAERLGGFHMAPRNHLSALGYRWMAREMVSLLSGAARWTVPLLRVSHCAELSRHGRVGRTLQDAESLTITAAGAPLGVLVEAEAVPHSAAPAPARMDFAALVELGDPLRPRLLKSPARLTNGAPIRLRFRRTEAEEEILLGTLHSDPSGLCGRPRLDWTERQERGWRLQREASAPGLHMLAACEDGVAHAQLLIGDLAPLTAALESGPVAGWQRLQIVGEPGRFLLLRGHPEMRLGELMARRRGTLYLEASWPEHLRWRSPLLDFSIEPKTMSRRRVLDPPVVAP